MTANRRFERVILVAVFLYIALTLVVAGYLAHAPADAPLRGLVRFPPCAMRVRLGIPCPLCFGTRTYILIWHGQWGMALRMNPFAFALFWLSAAGLVALIWLAFSRRPVRYWTGRIRRRTWIAVMVVVFVFFLSNWVYLIFREKARAPLTIRKL